MRKVSAANSKWHIQWKMASLFTADFPPYTIFPLRTGEFYIAGGGGTAKTGVPNALVS